jgi:two-component system, OmpR family, phosphate regulon sensor histidine kinase PhoR
MTIRIQQRLTIIFSIIFAVVFTGIYFYLESKLTQDAYRSIRESLRQKVSLSRIYIEESSASTAEQWDMAADRIGAALSLRTTIIAGDGKVLGDSELVMDQVRTVENHLHRPEVQKALAQGFGEERRYSMTVNQDMLYMAMPVVDGEPVIVRLAIPLTELC